MKSPSMFGRHRIAVLVILLIMLGGTLALISPVEARAACAVITEYYSDATLSIVVGVRGSDCDCKRVSWGVMTPYFRIGVLPCPKPGA